MSISIFAKRAFLNINPHEPFAERKRPLRKGQGHLLRVSSIIRGEQVAEQIGAKFNPESGYENDVCIYVKPYFKKRQDAKADIKFEGKPYLDMIDGHNLAQLAERHPEVTVIVCSQADYDIMTKVIPNKIVVIPQHHCNFERVKRTRKKVTTVGCIGTRLAFPYLPKNLKKELAKRKMELIEFSRFFTRQDIIDFYLKIDVQIVWRPYKKILSNPLKLVNAASFGIPTIALDENAFKEISGCYMPVKTLDEFLIYLDALKIVPGLYDICSTRCLEKAEEYHIENIGKLYKALDK